MSHLKSLLAALAIVCLVGVDSTGQLQSVVIFDENFSKDVTGPVEVSRTFLAVAGTVTVSLTNGSDGGFDIVRSGRVEVNGQPVFTTNDFKVAGTISRTIAVGAGVNALDVSLGGPSGGRVTLKITQQQLPPGLQFPAGTIFVSVAHPNAADTATCGSAPSSPCRTIGQGIARAAASVGPQVVVGNGVYPEHVTIFPGVSLLGGYDVEFTRRDLTVFYPILRGSATGLFATAVSAVSATAIETPTTLEGFIILAPTATAPSSNSIGILIRNSTDALTVQNNIILGGVGAAGSNGSFGSNGANGGDGRDGIAAISVSVGGSLLVNAGGAGGLGFGGFSGGGAGGSAGAPFYNQRQGNGAASGTAVGGAGGFDGQASLLCGVTIPTAGTPNGQQGADGANGLHGAGGAGGAGGGFVAGMWQSAWGGSGASGQRGGGAAGGGAGGGLEGLFICDAVLGGSVKTGPSGGGGGAGAGAGIGGGGGAGGGSSIGILVVAGTEGSHPRIGANEIQLGSGGPGGAGGAGGIGGTGGSGGVGGAAALVANLGAVTGVGGNGGKGGNGGHGGGGGGGAGGNAFGILANFDGGPYATDNVFVTSGARGGEGGLGGHSIIGVGQAGARGSVAAVRLIPQ